MSAEPSILSVPAKQGRNHKVSDIVLLTLTGPDQQGLTAQLTAIMANTGLRLLDVGQSVIHNNVSLGMLVQLPGDPESGRIVRDLVFAAHGLGMNLRLSPVAPADYQAWVASQGQQRHVITLLARSLAAEHLAGLSDIVSRQGLNIESIHRLTGRVDLDANPSLGKACIELTLAGTPSDVQQMRAEFLALSAALEVDIAFQEDSIWRRNRRLVVFDMDSTLIEQEVIDELAHEAGVGQQVAEITEAAMRGEIEFQESFRQRLALLAGMDASVLDSIAARLRITEGAERLLSTLKALGYKTAILSGGFDYFGRHLQARLGIDDLYANQLEIVDGRVTGRVLGEIVDGQRKASLVRELAQRQGISLEQVIAVGDGANDLPMLSIAGLGIAFRAKPIVKKSAKQAISNLGLDGILYLLGYRDRDDLESR